MRALRFGSSIAFLVGAIAIVIFNADMPGLLGDARRLSIPVLGTIFAALLANSLAAALRFRTIAGDVGYPISLRQAMAAVSGGSLAGAAFFQIAGQLMARGFIMAKGGVPFASVAVMTLYERFVAAIISGLLALGGAYFIFGQIYLDQNSGGSQLIKIICGFIGAAAAGAVAGYGRIAARAIVPLATRDFAARFLRIVGLSLLVQLPMMAAYVAAAGALSPKTPISDLAAASAIVMFAASIPISLAGWGVREMSAIIALGAIGVEVGNAVLAAVIVGACSMLAMVAMATISLPGLRHEDRKNEDTGRTAINYGTALAWSLPLGAATLVLFQLYIPISSGTLLNVNLADPLAILAGTLFVLKCVQQGRVPQWRFQWLNMTIAAATLVIVASLLAGAARFGWTEWAVVNRFVGWFMLLAFAATGAMIVNQGGARALQVFLMTFAAATAAIAALEIIQVALGPLGLSLQGPKVSSDVEGFSQNRNFFAFQVLMAISAVTVAAERGSKLRIAIFSVLMAGLLLSGSRSGWIALVFLLGTSIYLRAAGAREIAISAVCSVTLIAATIVPSLSVGGGDHISQVFPQIVPTKASSNERLASMIGGLEMFLAHPIFGAGLGAFRNQLILAASGIPLLIHSTTIWLLAETGIVGLLVFVVPALCLLIAEARRARPDVSSKLIVLCLVSFAVMSGPADMLYQRTFWLLMGAALAEPFTHTES